MALVWHTKHWIAFPVGVLGILLIIISLFGIGKRIENEIEEADPYFYDDPVFEERWEKWLNYGSGLFMILSFIGLTMLRFYTTNTLREVNFAGTCSLISIIVASLITSLLLKKYPFLKPKNETRYKELTCLWVGFGCTTAILLISMNFFMPPISQVQRKVAILEHGIKKIEREAYIWVNFDGKKMKFRPNSEDYQALKNSDSTIMTISRGPLGFEYICEMLPD